MRYLDSKLPIEIELLGQTISKILRGVVQIINIPLKPILEANIINLYIQLKYLQALLRPSPIIPVMTDGLLDAVHYLALEWHQQGVLGHEELYVLLWGEIGLVYVPAEHLFVLFAIRLQLQVDGDQVLLGCYWALAFYVQGVGDQVELFIDCLIQSSVSGTTRVQAVQPVSQIALNINIIALNRTLEPQREGRVVDTGLASNINLLDIVLCQCLKHLGPDIFVLDLTLCHSLLLLGFFYYLLTIEFWDVLSFIFFGGSGF